MPRARNRKAKKKAQGQPQIGGATPRAARDGSPDSVARATRSATKGPGLAADNPGVQPPVPIPRRISLDTSGRPSRETRAGARPSHDSKARATRSRPILPTHKEASPQQTQATKATSTPTVSPVSGSRKSTKALKNEEKEVEAGTRVPIFASHKLKDPPPVILLTESPSSSQQPVNLKDSPVAAENVIEVVESPTRTEICSMERGVKPVILPRTMMRSFDYPVRTWPTVERPAFVLSNEETEDYEDPYHDFPTEDWTVPKITQKVSGFVLEEILNCINTPAWLGADYLAFYTMFSQRGRGQYDEESDLFSAYFPPTEQHRLYRFFNTSLSEDANCESSEECEKCILACWKLFHPGSYYSWVGEKIAADPVKHAKMNNKRYLTRRKLLGTVPLSFNGFKKRVISFISCDSSHFVAYFGVNVGAWLNSPTDEVPQEECFIVDMDALYNSHTKQLYSFFHFILEVARRLEVWVGKYLSLQVGDPLIDPDFDSMARESKRVVKKETARVCKIPMTMPRQRVQQRDDKNCGAFAALNVYSVYQAERHHYAKLEDLTSVDDFVIQIHAPFWKIPVTYLDLNQEEKVEPDLEVKPRLKSFRDYLLDIMIHRFYKNTEFQHLTRWGINYMLEHDMEQLLPQFALDDISARREEGRALPGTLQDDLTVYTRNLDSATRRSENAANMLANAKVEVQWAQDHNDAEKKITSDKTLSECQEEFKLASEAHTYALGKVEGARIALLPAATSISTRSTITSGTGPSLARLELRADESPKLTVVEGGEDTPLRKEDSDDSTKTDEDFADEKQDADFAAGESDQEDPILPSLDPVLTSTLASAIANPVLDRLAIPSGKAGGKATAKSVLDRLAIPPGEAGGKAAATTPIDEPIITQQRLLGEGTVRAGEGTRARKKRLKKERLDTSKRSTPRPTKTTTPIDNTREGLFFARDKQQIARQKKITEKIRRRRGIVSERMMKKKTKEEQQEYARHHEEIFCRVDGARAAKKKAKIARQAEKEASWDARRRRMEKLFAQKKRLNRKEEKEIDGLLENSFPEHPLLSSDDSSISSLDSQLTSDSSDDEWEVETGSETQLQRKQARENKRAKKLQHHLERKERRIAFRVRKQELAAARAVEEIEEEVTQIAKLRYIPIQYVADDEVFNFKSGKRHEMEPSAKRFKCAEGSRKYYPARYQSMCYDYKGRSVIAHSLTIAWTENVFNSRFTQLVKNVGISENNTTTKWSKRRWIPVPAGNVIDPKPPNELINLSRTRCHYQQKEFNTCVFKAMASAFHAAGSKPVASYLSSIARAKGNQDMDSRTQVERLMTAIRRRESVYKKGDLYTSETAIATVDMYGGERSPQLWILLGRDGGTSHAVGVFGNNVFDSNVPYSMKLTKETLDWCCNCEGGFNRIHTFVRFRK